MRPLAPAIGIIAALAAGIVPLLALSGCPQRQEIARQTTRAQVDDVMAEIESSRVPAELLTWEQVLEVQPGADVRAVAARPGGGFYVAWGTSVAPFDAEGRALLEQPLSFGEVPICLAATADTLYVGLTDRIHLIDPATWELRRTIRPDEARVYITCVAADSTGIIVADAGDRLLLHYDAEGRLVSRIGESDDRRGVPGLKVPSPHLDVAILPGGSLLATNPGAHSVQVYSPDGALQQSWGGYSPDLAGFCGCCNPTDIALLPDGRVVTSEKGTPRVKVYTADGRLQSVIVPPSDFDASTRGIDLATDEAGRVLVADPGRGRVRLYRETAAPEEERM